MNDVPMIRGVKSSEYRNATLLAAFLIAFTSLCHASVTLYVPTEYPTIQAGIDAATNGDTVVVAEGVYTGPGNRDIDFNGKLITLTSTNGAENCIIDCQQQTRAFYLHSGETTQTVINGFTICNGNTTNLASYWGGAIWGHDVSPTISGNIISNNTARGFGGAIYLSADNGIPISARIICNLIISNQVVSGSGGGIEWFSQTTNQAGSIVSNTIVGNVCSHYGGGLEVQNSVLTIRDNTITGNGFGADGGGIEVSGWGTIIVNNTITSNQVGRYGGGIDVDGGAVYIISNTISYNLGQNGAGIRYGGGTRTELVARISGNIISHNRSRDMTRSNTGGGIEIRGGFAQITIENNRIVDNAVLGYPKPISNSEQKGGGIFCMWASPTIRNNWIIGNSVSGNGGGGGIQAYCPATGETAPMILNNVIASNSAPSGAGIYVATDLGNPDGCMPTIVNNTILGNTTGGVCRLGTNNVLIANCILWGNNDELTNCVAVYSNIEDGDPGEGNIATDPQLSGSYHLLLGSPCIDVGTNLSVLAETTDIDEEPRTVNRRVDVGADESFVMLCRAISCTGTVETLWEVPLDLNYQLQARDHLFSGDWGSVGKVLTATQSVLTAIDTNALPQCRFYRLRWCP